MIKYQQNPQIMDAEIDNEQVMMNIDLGKYLGLNHVGKRIWDLMKEPKTSDEISTVLLNEFQVEKNVCEHEVQSFLEQAQNLESSKFINNLLD